ncbi:MAG: PGPGW domain-containing protein [Prosthecobacter sp.]
MFAHAHKDWEAFKASPPGRRFQDVHKRREKEGGKSSTVRRMLLLGLGLVLTAVGMFFLFVPGPGTITMFIGIALIARQSLLVARCVDRLEVLLRPSYLWLRRRWRALSRTQRVALSAVATVLGCLMSVGLYLYMR